MGLDSVEILMEVENAFGIRIPDAEAEKIITVGDFHNSVWKHLEGRQIERCHSQVLFYRLRSTLAEKTKFDHRSITLKTSPNSLWPISNRRQVYKELQSDLSLSLPALKLPDPWSDLLAWTSIVLVVGSLVVEFILINFFNYNAWIWLGTLAALGIVLGISEMLEPLRTKVGQADMREFTMQVLKDNYKQLVRDSGTNRRDMEAVINQIIADKVGLDIVEIEPSKRIADDLGVD
jgi:acyl carrier protein